MLSLLVLSLAAQAPDLAEAEATPRYRGPAGIMALGGVVGGALALYVAGASNYRLGHAPGYTCGRFGIICSSSANVSEGVSLALVAAVGVVITGAIWLGIEAIYWKVKER